MERFKFVFCVVVLGLQTIKGDDVTTTTEATKTTVSVPRTTLYRSGFGHETETTTKGEDLLKKQIDDFRRTYKEIWDWDYWCQLQPKKGNCTENIPKYYYDAQLDQCMTFSFSGCQGNKNSFISAAECERHCKGSAYVVLKNTDPGHICSLQPNSGLCLAMLPRYYYDINENRCKTFSYGGCSGNNNRFEDETSCANTCQYNLGTRAGRSYLAVEVY